jgi:endonuclease III-like uncharacterized protein
LGRNTGGRRRSAFEVMIGAILTQNTSWPNVAKAIITLKEKKFLNAGTL